MDVRLRDFRELTSVIQQGYKKVSGPFEFITRCIPMGTEYLMGSFWSPRVPSGNHQVLGVFSRQQTQHFAEFVCVSTNKPQDLLLRSTPINNARLSQGTVATDKELDSGTAPLRLLFTESVRRAEITFE